MFKLSHLIFCFSLLCSLGNSQLIINVKNQGGDILQESIAANISENTVVLEFQKADGTWITQLNDFTNDIQILRALVLGEEERGQSQYQVMCFVTHVEKNEFISTDAMSKLRQKNPSTIRTPEEDRGTLQYEMNYFINLPTSSILSRYISPLCSEAADATYTRHEDLEMWANKPGASELTLKSALKPFPIKNHQTNTVDSSYTSCKNTVSIMKLPCQCNFEITIGWYPCGLKYCKGKLNPDNKNSALNSNSYRCGIKTCKRSYVFSYYVSQKHFCLWDE